MTKLQFNKMLNRIFLILFFIKLYFQKICIFWLISLSENQILLQRAFQQMSHNHMYIQKVAAGP